MNPRVVFFIGFIGAAGALAFAYLLQYGFGLAPCPLCIFQRVAMLGVALACLAGVVHGAAGPVRWLYGALGALAAGAGAAIAGRHVWLQSLPADEVPACGPDLNYLLDVMPWSQVLAMVLRGDASCAEIDAAFLGLSLPFWTLVVFLVLLVCCVAAGALVRRPA